MRNNPINNQRLRDLYDRNAHGLHNDTTRRYDKDAAELAWRLAIEFFRHNPV
jgi:carboxymethylenebutenolidase